MPNNVFIELTKKLIYGKSTYMRYVNFVGNNDQRDIKMKAGVNRIAAPVP